MAPARSHSDISIAAQKAVTALLKITSSNSPVGVRIVQELSPSEKTSVMSQLIAVMRRADWSKSVAGIHGAVILGKDSPDALAALEAFVSGLLQTNLDKGMSYLLKQQKLIPR
jgi:hypothetical protein